MGVDMDQVMHEQDSRVYVDISLLAISRMVVERKALFLAVYLIIVGASIAYAFLATPLYRSEVITTPVSGGSSGAGGLQRMLTGFGGAGMLLGGFGNSSTRNARAAGMSALTSPYFTRAFIEENNMLPQLFADKWDAETGEWAVDSPEDIPTLSEGYEYFVENVLEVLEDERTGLVTVAIEWVDPAVSAQWANSLVAAVNERLRSRAIQDADQTISYLNDEVAATNAVELQQALYFLIESEIQTRTVAKVQQEYTFRVLSPALEADDDKFVHPNRLFIISLSLLVGLLAAFFVVSMAGVAGQIRRQFK